MAAGPGPGRNEVFTALLAESGLTQSELAARVNRESERIFGQHPACTDAQVRRWLSGRVNWPQPRYLLPLEEIFGLPATRLGFVPRGRTSTERIARLRSGLPPGREPADRPAPSGADPVLRREFVGMVAGVAAGGVPGVLPPAGRIGMTEVSVLQARLAELHGRDAHSGGDDLVTVAARHASAVEVALAECRYGERVGRALYATAGEFAASAGWFAFDAGDHAAAERHCDQALRLAILGNDPVVQSHAWAVLALQALHRGRPAESAALADVGLAGAAARRDPLVAALFHARAGAAGARTGEAKGFGRSFSLAERALDNARVGEDVPPWLAFFGPAELSGIAAKSLLSLGRYAEAGSTAERSVGGIAAGFDRNRLCYRLAYAEARLGLRDVDGACAAATEVARELTAVRSRRSKAYLGQFRTQLEPWRAEPAARDFIDGYDRAAGPGATG